MKDSRLEKEREGRRGNGWVSVRRGRKKKTQGGEKEKE